MPKTDHLAILCTKAFHCSRAVPPWQHTFRARERSAAGVRIIAPNCAELRRELRGEHTFRAKERSWQPSKATTAAKRQKMAMRPYASSISGGSTCSLSAWNRAQNVESRYLQ